MTWFDSHFHLDEEDCPEHVLDDARQAGVTRFMILGTSLNDCGRTVRLGDPDHGVFTAAGLHPHAAETFDSLEPFREWHQTPGCLAVGEIGLDYFYDFAPREAQRRVFARFLDFAQELDKPIVIHCRQAFRDCLDIVRAHLAPGFPFLIHSFADTPAEAEQWLELGAMLSVNGMVTFNKADNIRESLTHIPLDRLLIETDSPYLAPKPHRGKRNCPAFIPLIGQRVAQERGLPVETVEQTTTDNAIRFFRAR